ncbi:MAG: biotin/lipoyl-binding protein [Clostridia bacterium]|nr:biotin/lipoyl-binding protein [Clostridia bacterium]
MKQYKVNVNGTLYEITLEVVEGAEIAAAPAPVAAPVAAAPVAEAAPAPAPAAAPVVAGAGEAIIATMPGNILAVNVKAGDAVKKGDVLMILEAMKMENEIMAPADGTVVSVNVNVGATVETGTALCVLG